VKAIEPDVSKWDAWRPEEAARLLQGVDAPWYIAGGWAIDLFLGGQRRDHEDLEIAVPSSRFDDVVEALPDFEFFVITGPGEAVALEDGRARFQQTHQTLAAGAGHRIVAAGRVPRAERRRHLDVPPEPFHHDALRALDRANRRRAPVRSS
jgi:hypothetical protein